MSVEEILTVVLMGALVLGGYRLIRRAVRLGTRDALRENARDVTTGAAASPPAAAVGNPSRSDGE
ncbi:hypothetical protein [Pseudactinotalea suaedae]|jgi:hypothetical protein|uniref:hypothetical protein n=1 Tax=Pseudactinotalea suaedae TaxID=1524924 RepID=UPI0012E1E6F2|nr:hypothetical protein [Pseudactinotalea suaedae]